MSLYKVDFFDRDLNNVHHDVIDDPVIDQDYLAPENSDIYIRQTNMVKASNFVYISGAFNFLGVVTSVSDSNYKTKVSIKPFITLFDTNVLFDVDWQSKSNVYLETILGNLIRKYWMNTGDDAANMNALQVLAETSTANWGFNLKPDTSSMLSYSNGNVSEKQNPNVHYCIINFYSTLICKAFTKYAITIVPEMDFGRKKIILKIRANNSLINIQVDRPGVNVKAFDIERMNQTVNKVYIHNTENYNTVAIYYLHTDGEYDTINEDRILPVIFDVKAATPNQEEGVTQAKAWENAAKEEAGNTFDNIDWESLIELEVELSDKLVDPLHYPIGTLTRIWYNGQPYNTILSGKKYSNSVTLYYGTVRTTLTKKKILANAKF